MHDKDALDDLIGPRFPPRGLTGLDAAIPACRTKENYVVCKSPYEILLFGREGARCPLGGKFQQVQLGYPRWIAPGRRPGRRSRAGTRGPPWHSQPYPLCPATQV